jgi:hypothetical protein
VDEYLQDQLVILMALASGRSELICAPLSMHTKTAMYFCQLLLGARFQVVEQSNLLAERWQQCVPAGQTATGQVGTPASAKVGAEPLAAERDDDIGQGEIEESTAGSLLGIQDPATNAPDFSRLVLLVCDGVGFQRR